MAAAVLIRARVRAIATVRVISTLHESEGGFFSPPGGPCVAKRGRDGERGGPPLWGESPPWARGTLSERERDGS